MFVDFGEEVVTIVALRVLMQMFLELAEFINMTFLFLPFFCIRDIEKILQKIIDALPNFISNFGIISLHILDPLKFALLNVKDAQ